MPPWCENASPGFHQPPSSAAVATEQAVRAQRIAVAAAVSRTNRMVKVMERFIAGYPLG